MATLCLIFLHICSFIIRYLVSLTNITRMYKLETRIKLLFHCDPSNIMSFKIPNFNILAVSKSQNKTSFVSKLYVLRHARPFARIMKVRARETMSLRLKKAGSVRLTFCFEFIGSYFVLCILLILSRVNRRRPLLSLFLINYNRHKNVILTGGGVRQVQ